VSETFDLATLTQPDDGVDVAKPEAEDLRLWSVTTLINVLDKPALTYWAAEETAKAAVAIARTLPARLEEEGAAAVIDHLKGARFRRPKDALSAKDLGSVAHRLFELWAITGVRPTPDEVRQVIDQHAAGGFNGHAAEGAVLDRMMDQFDRGWLDRFSPVYEATEVTVFHPDYGYAGTSDGYASIAAGRLSIFDYKTSRKSVDNRGKPTGPYSEVALQLAGYRFAPLAAVWRPRRFEQMRRRYYLLGPDERALAVPTPDVDSGLVVHVTPDHCTVHPVRCDEAVFTAFLYVLECSRWVNDLAPTVVGDPLET
jgi:hypothetical protein